VVGQDDATAFARGLQAAGYATDPNYADKLARIINGNTLRTALAAAPPSA
jgi:flagellar protein FlgJ